MDLLKHMGEDVSASGKREAEQWAKSSVISLQTKGNLRDLPQLQNGQFHITSQ